MCIRDRYYRERQRIKRRKEKRRRRIRSIVSSLEGIVLCLILISVLNYLPVFGNQGKEGRLADVFAERNGAEAGLIWGETETEETKAEEMTVEEMTAEAEAEAGAYDFSRPVPLSEPVDDSYFDDAVFIGDSRTEGLITNTGLSNTCLLYTSIFPQGQQRRV